MIYIKQSPYDNKYMVLYDAETNSIAIVHQNSFYANIVYKAGNGHMKDKLSLGSHFIEGILKKYPKEIFLLGEL